MFRHSATVLASVARFLCVKIPPVIIEECVIKRLVLKKRNLRRHAQDKVTAQNSALQLPLPADRVLVGRDEEVADVLRRLADPACRLLTLVGPGGIGKTHLALRVAGETRGNYAAGAVFVNLEAVDAPQSLAAAVAAACDFSLSGSAAPQRQLLNYLSQREMLLVLDNFEHLLGQGERRGGVELLADVLQAAPHVQLLVTSRTALNLREEWLYPLQGLSLPPHPGVENLRRFGAVRLFVERARRVQPDFSLEESRAGVVHLCQLVEGMPLALELAAAWCRTLPPAAIASEIQRNINFLTVKAHNLPDRHRSIQAVFNHSWEFLPQEERKVFKKLAVFPGRFGREAAGEVAGASLEHLARLIDRSLLRREPGDGGERYRIHPLLRHYAAERLAETPDEDRRTREAHARYFADFLAQRTPAMRGEGQREAVAEIAANLESVGAAWAWLVRQGDARRLHKATYSYVHFYDFQGRYRESIDALEEAVRALEENGAESQEALAHLLCHLGWSYIRVGQHGQAQRALERSRTLYETLNAAPRPGLGTDPLTGLAILANISGAYEQAVQLGQQARRQNEEEGDTHNLQLAHYVLAGAALGQGRNDDARRHAQQAQSLCKETGNRWFLAYVRNTLGDVGRMTGDFHQAEEHYEAAYAIRKEFDDPEGMALALNNLGKVAMQRGDQRRAGDLFRESKGIYQEIGDRGGLAAALNGLGTTYAALGKVDEARDCLAGALQIANDIRYVPLTLAVLAAIGRLFLRLGQEQRGARLLAFAAGHPAGSHELQELGQEILQGQDAAPETVDEVKKAGDLDEIVARLLRDLQMPLPSSTDGPSASEKPQQPLVDPLTAREMQVLALIAEGLTNKEIAEELVISVGTVKWYTSQIYGKLGVGNRTGAVARARELALL